MNKSVNAMDTDYLDKLFDFTGRTIWVVGGAGYLGGPAVYALAKSGARVLCADLPGQAAALAKESGMEDRIIPAELDAFDHQAVKAFVAENLGRYGVPHGLFNLTTGSSGKAIEQVTEEDFDVSAQRSLTCAFILAREVGQAMIKEGRGSVVFTSSMYGTIAPDPDIYEPPMSPNPVDYGACKAGVQAMARYFAAMWGRHQVRFNSISPGAFPKPFQQEADPEFAERLKNKAPAKRIGRREEIAGPALFLLSDASTFVHGQNLAADGGWTCL